MSINPSLLRVWRKKFFDPRGNRHYRASFLIRGQARYSRLQWKTAEAALAYGDRVLARWKRLYQVASRIQKLEKVS